jgi:hypothetical protein
MSLSALGSIFERFLGTNVGQCEGQEPTSVDVRVILLVENDKIDEYIHPCIELETLRARVVCMGMDNMVILSLYQTTTRKQRFR